MGVYSKVEGGYGNKGIQEWVRIIYEKYDVQ